MRSLYSLRVLLALSLALSLPLGPPGASAEPQVALGKTPSSLLPLVYSPQLNAQSSYHFEMKTTMEHDLSSVMSALMGSVTQQNPGVQLPQGPLAQKQSLEVVFSGRFNHRVIKKSSAGIVLSAQLSETSYSQNGVENDEPLLFESPFLIKLTPQGLIKNVSFLPEVPETNKHLIKSLVEQTQFSLSGEFNIDWRSREIIADTSYVTSYHREKDDFNKNIVRLTKRYSSPTSLSSNELAKLIPTIDEMTTTAEVAIDGSGLRSLSHTGALRYTHKGKLTASGRSILTMDKMDEVNITLLDSEEALMSSEARKALKRISGYKIPRALLKQVALLSVSQVVKGYVNIMSVTGPKHINIMNAMRFVKAYIIQYPDRSDELMSSIFELQNTIKGSDSDLFAPAAGAFVQVNHDQAQKAIISHLKMPNGVVLRTVAMSLLTMKFPSLSIAEALWEVRNRAYVQRSQMKEVLTGVFGSLGSVKHENPEVTDYVASQLNELIKSGSDRDRYMALTALSNLKDASLILPTITPLLNSADSSDRRHAFLNFKYLEGEEPFKLFAQHFQREQDDGVLKTASKVATRMPRSTARTLWAREQLLNHKIPAVKKEAARILGRELESVPENEEALRLALKTTKDRIVRREIFVYVAPTRRKK